MNTCNHCGATFVKTNATAVKCPHCDMPLYFSCYKCGQPEPSRFINADVCMNEAVKIRNEFYKQTHDFTPFAIICVACIIIILSTFLKLLIVFFIGIILLAVGLLYEEIIKRAIGQEFSHFNPTIAKLFLDE